MGYSKYGKNASDASPSDDDKLQQKPFKGTVNRMNMVPYEMQEEKITMLEDLGGGPRHHQRGPLNVGDVIVDQQYIPPPGFNFAPPSFNCVDVANHISSCPICSKLYNNDKSMYIIVIIILSILVILLLKRVLEL